MRFLCPRHQQIVQRNPELAMTLWEGAMESGLNAWRGGDWQAARNFFGSAYQTALLYLCRRPSQPAGQFQVTHLVDAGKALSRALNQLQQWDEAQVCLLTLQNCLVQDAWDETAAPQARAQVLAMTESYIDALIHSAGLASKLPHSRELVPASLSTAH